MSGAQRFILVVAIGAMGCSADDPEDLVLSAAPQALIPGATAVIGAESHAATIDCAKLTAMLGTLSLSETGTATPSCSGATCWLRLPSGSPRRALALYTAGSIIGDEFINGTGYHDTVCDGTTSPTALATYSVELLITSTVTVAKDAGH